MEAMRTLAALFVLLAGCNAGSLPAGHPDLGNVERAEAVYEPCRPVDLGLPAHCFTHHAAPPCVR
jgi:hypothetical protein